MDGESEREREREIGWDGICQEWTGWDRLDRSDRQIDGQVKDNFYIEIETQGDRHRDR